MVLELVERLDGDNLNTHNSFGYIFFKHCVK